MEDKKERRGRKRCLTISDPQKKTLEVISYYIEKHGYSPTIKEIADTLGITHTSTHAQIKYMVRNGYLKREGKKARGLSIIRKPLIDRSELISIPILGTVAAGRPIFATENIAGEIFIERNVARSGHYFALKIKGDSMIDAEINDGDLVIVKQQPVAENGEIIVALLGDEATVKKFYFHNDHIELIAENKNYKPILVNLYDEFRILGKVVGVRHISNINFLNQ